MGGIMPKPYFLEPWRWPPDTTAVYKKTGLVDQFWCLGWKIPFYNAWRKKDDIIAQAFQVPEMLEVESPLESAIQVVKRATEEAWRAFERLTGSHKKFWAWTLSVRWGWLRRVLWGG